MPKVKVNDIQLYYETHGEGEPLILIAGFSADHVAWYSVVKHFSQRYQVIVFDNRGAGQTDIPDGPYSIAQMADDVASLCEALSIDSAHFIGNSMGGCILQALINRHPSIVKSAIISNSTYKPETCFNYFAEAMLALIKANAPQAAIIKANCAWVFSYQFLSQPGMMDGLVELGMKNAYPFTAKGCAGQLAALREFDAREYLGKINVPTLVIAGDQDLIFNGKSTQDLADKIPHAKYYCFENCGHLPFIEYPEQFVRVVQDFFQGE